MRRRSLPNASWRCSCGMMYRMGGRPRVPVFFVPATGYEVATCVRCHESLVATYRSCGRGVQVALF